MSKKLFLNTKSEYKLKSYTARAPILGLDLRPHLEGKTLDPDSKVRPQAPKSKVRRQKSNFRINLIKTGSTPAPWETEIQTMV